ncbi:7SK snRNA methylphosphate capping enzyme [Trachymyrmex septentrionalis]|uniref:RNA methyltransferase n=1 Tax=Trachymyrmex septentrionalis TaxID=34720 RepID=A0A195F5W0_9HYME|nr:PREDICTED: probable RNA methyltransferase bin3 [Trachymyrmex septentrionalis]KYN35975.1 7SK snRNA methylphosphate capping enzyme [Trachymyrmex septentrionalis]
MGRCHMDVAVPNETYQEDYHQDSRTSEWKREVSESVGLSRFSKMSSVQVDRPPKVSQNNKKENEKFRKVFNVSHKKHNKHEDSRYFKQLHRKRPQSSFCSNGKSFPPYKRRKKEGIIIPPTKFLLGGNICDPLNLNSMQDEEINRAMNAVTPKSSPLPTPKHKKEIIEVIIPPNICDPLNLTNCNDNEEYEKQLISPIKRNSKRRNRKRKRAYSGSGKDEGKMVDPNETNKLKETEGNNITDKASTERLSGDKISLEETPSTQNENCLKDNKTESPQKDKNRLRLKGLEEIKDKRLRKIDAKDKIVSPVIPQPGAWKPRPQHRPSQDKKKKQQHPMPNFRLKDARYQYGNYNRYYGYRNPHHEVDPRLKMFVQRKELFLQKDILDIGCNIGHITLSVARDFGAKSVTGIDIDRTLINIARKNVKHYVNCVQSPASNEDNDKRDSSDASFFPMSMPISYGPVDIPGFTKNKHKGFPYNVIFVQGNYVLENDSLLCAEQTQFDTILCLSITKWIHLNFGDAGLKQAFKRMHAQLRPGGVLVLEPQGWASYTKKKNLTERIYKNYHNIEFRPHNFTQYLLSTIGFCQCEVVSIPPHPSKGFQRPIHLFTKAGGPSPTITERVNDNITSDTLPSRQERMTRRDQEEIRDMERMKYEQELFPKENNNTGNMSEISQHSGDLNQYEQLANVYAPSATPNYDTPSRNSDSQPSDSQPSDMPRIKEEKEENS